jgi:hypothetical protein
MCVAMQDGRSALDLTVNAATRRILVRYKPLLLLLENV